MVASSSATPGYGTERRGARSNEVWLHHAATGAVIGCENLAPYLPPAALRAIPFPKVAAAWKKILAWPGRALFGYHEPPGQGFVGDARAALAAAVQAAGQG
jgi:hypothetical protein